MTLQTKLAILDQLYLAREQATAALLTITAHELGALTNLAYRHVKTNLVNTRSAITAATHLFEAQEVEADPNPEATTTSYILSDAKPPAPATRPETRGDQTKR